MLCDVQKYFMKRCSLWNYRKIWNIGVFFMMILLHIFGNESLANSDFYTNKKYKRRGKANSPSIKNE